LRFSRFSVHCRALRLQHHEFYTKKQKIKEREQTLQNVDIVLPRKKTATESRRRQFVDGLRKL
jgi:hypothetical protein